MTRVTLIVLLSGCLAIFPGCRKAKKTHSPSTSPTTPPATTTAIAAARPVFREETDSSTGAKYWICVPGTYRPQTPAPLIVTCHATPPFGRAEYQAKEWKHLAERHGCIVLAPALEGTDGIVGDAPSAAMATDEKLILSIISTTAARYNVDKANVMLTGFSGGGFPTYWVGLRHPEIFSVIVARSCNFSRASLEGGRAFDPPSIKPPVMISWGENDLHPIVQQSRNAAKYLRARGYDVATPVMRGVGFLRHAKVAMGFFLKHQRPPKPSFPAGGKK